MLGQLRNKIGKRAVASSCDAAADEELVAAATKVDELGFESSRQASPAKDFCTRVPLHTSSGGCRRHCSGNFPESIRPLAAVRREILLLHMVNAYCHQRSPDVAAQATRTARGTSR